MFDVRLKKLWKFPVAALSVVALLLAWLSLSGLNDPKVIPFGDGGAYYRYALRLYGLLHSGQFIAFFRAVSEPVKNLFPTATIFLLLPHSYANSAGYGLANTLGWHLSGALGIWLLLRALKAERFAIPVLILSCANVYHFDASYFYYMDLPFVGITLVSIGMFACALRCPTRSILVLAGALTGLTFFAKASNAFLTLGLLGVFCLGTLASGKDHVSVKAFMSTTSRFILWAALGFVPVFLVSALCGGIDSILGSVAAYTLSDGWITKMQETGIFRVLYFPLCLAYFYSIPAVAAACLALVACRFLPARIAKITCLENSDSAESDRMTKAIVIWLLIAFVVIYGIYFSFFLQCKVMRALLFMPPLLWIVLFAGTHLRRLRVWVAISVALLLFSFSYLQMQYGLMDGVRNLQADYFTLKGDWWNRWPAQRPDMTRGPSTTQNLYDLIKQAGVLRGKVTVGSQMMFWGPNDLSIICNQNALRAGRTPDYTFGNFGSSENWPPSRSQFLGANALLLVLEPRAQYDRRIFEQSAKLANYATTNWEGKGARILRTTNGRGQHSVWLIAFDQPLATEILAQAEKDKAIVFRSDEVDQRSTDFEHGSLQERLRILRSARNPRDVP